MLPKDRPQNVAEMRALLAALPPRAAVHDDPADLTVPMVDVLLPPPPTAAVRPSREPARDAPAVAIEATAEPKTRRRSIAIGGAVVLIAVAALAGGRIWFAQPQVPAAAPAASAPESAQPPPRLVPAPAPAPAPAAASVVTTPPSAQVEESPPTSPPPTTAPADTEPPPSAATAGAPEVAASAAVPSAEPSPPRKHAPVRAPREPMPAPQASQHIPNKKLPSARCADIIQRVSLGEPLNDAEKTILKRECGP